MIVGFGSSSLTNNSDETLDCKSFPLSCVHSIEDGVLRFCHVACEEEVSHNRVRSIVNRRLRFLHASIEVDRAHLILAVITLQMNVRD